MKLLKRIATNKKDQTRKDAATSLLAAQDKPIIDTWNRQLEAEIRRKKHRPGRA
jgi:hypothetical protein